jgi:hypothetical protein
MDLLSIDEGVGWGRGVEGFEHFLRGAVQGGLGDGEEGVEAGWAWGFGWGTRKNTLQFDV